MGNVFCITLVFFLPLSAYRKALIVSNLLHRVLRHRGCFGNVSLVWQLFENGSALNPGEEFYEVSGTVWFTDGEGSKPIMLHAIPDKIPEFNEFYILKLVNASGIVGPLVQYGRGKPGYSDNSKWFKHVVVCANA